MKYSPAKWSLNIVKDKTTLTSALDETEPGFNLTEEEIIKFKIWRQGIIPYYIDDFSFDKVLRDRIRNYLDLTNRLTGLRFMELPKPPTDEQTRWVLFVNRKGLLGCADHSVKDFTNQGVQKVILGYDCLVTGGELAEAVMALVGVPPQHNSPDRQKYIKVIEENIIPEKRHLFEVLRNDEWLFHEIPYDYFSSSHYGLHKYTRNGFATIELQEKNSIKASDCIKLFEPGANFSNYKPLLEDNVQPRDKPNRYLGKGNLPRQKDDQNGAKINVEKGSQMNSDEYISPENNTLSTENNTLNEDYSADDKGNKVGNGETQDNSVENSFEERNVTIETKSQKHSTEERNQYNTSKKENNVTVNKNKNQNEERHNPHSEYSDSKSWETTKGNPNKMQRKFKKLIGK